MEWKKTSEVLPKDGDRVIGIMPKAYLRSEILWTYIYEEDIIGDTIYKEFVDSDGNRRSCKDIVYWTPIENIPSDIKL